jgi:hypothetical protein
VLENLLSQKKHTRSLKKSAKKIKQEAEERTRLGGDDTELVKWFKARMKQMSGSCMKCGARTETHVYAYAIYSICHILDKRSAVCPSVSIHPLNWIELCPDHHTEFDKKDWDAIEKWGCWPEILERLVAIEPDVAQSERRHLPQQLLTWIEKNKPF